MSHCFQTLIYHAFFFKKRNPLSLGVCRLAMSIEDLFLLYSDNNGAYEPVHLQGLISATCGRYPT